MVSSFAAHSRDGAGIDDILMDRHGWSSSGTLPTTLPPRFEFWGCDASFVDLMCR